VGTGHPYQAVKTTIGDWWNNNGAVLNGPQLFDEQYEVISYTICCTVWLIGNYHPQYPTIWILINQRAIWDGTGAASDFHLAIPSDTSRGPVHARTWERSNKMSVAPPEPPSSP
jgi:hypothetical protein